MTSFLRPSRAQAASDLWCRCDGCHWSGPYDRFLIFTRGKDIITLCPHYWCAGDQELMAYLQEEGWVL